MLTSFSTQTITRLRPTLAADGHGNLEPNWSAATELVIDWCSVQPGATEEDLAGRDSTLIQWTVFAPLAADIRPGDRIRYKGKTYDGEPARWETGILDHQVVFLKTWEG
jgi:hypothetical protein